MLKDTTVLSHKILIYTTRERKTGDRERNKEKPIIWENTIVNWFIIHSLFFPIYFWFSIFMLFPSQKNIHVVNISFFLTLQNLSNRILHPPLLTLTLLTNFHILFFFFDNKKDNLIFFRQQKNNLFKTTLNQPKLPFPKFPPENRHTHVRKTGFPTPVSLILFSVFPVTGEDGGWFILFIFLFQTPWRRMLTWAVCACYYLIRDVHVGSDGWMGDMGGAPPWWGGFPLRDTRLERRRRWTPGTHWLSYPFYLWGTIN